MIRLFAGFALLLALSASAFAVPDGFVQSTVLKVLAERSAKQDAKNAKYKEVYDEMKEFVGALHESRLKLQLDAAAVVNDAKIPLALRDEIGLTVKLLFYQGKRTDLQLLAVVDASKADADQRSKVFAALNAFNEIAARDEINKRDMTMMKIGATLGRADYIITQYSGSVDALRDRIKEAKAPPPE